MDRLNGIDDLLELLPDIEPVEMEGLDGFDYSIARRLDKLDNPD